MNVIVVKISGSILENEKNLDIVLDQLKEVLNNLNTLKCILIIPGGGSYANFIRKIDHRISLEKDLSHWEAIYAMEYNATQILKKFPNLFSINKPEQLLDILGGNKNKKFLSIFLPFEYLYEKDELPHEWNVTSDSVTAYIAYKLGISQCFLIKNVDGIISKNGEIIREIASNDLKTLIENSNLKKIRSPNSEYKESQPIDSYILNIIRNFNINVIILNGSTNKSKILNYFLKSKDREKVYTKIYS
ncbi:MAG: hypothetical protein P8Y70_11450 [Candidatus Lokiarchaeota archaeon]